LANEPTSVNFKVLNQVNNPQGYSLNLTNMVSSPMAGAIIDIYHFTF
jgi:hypothetical protein